MRACVCVCVCVFLCVDESARRASLLAHVQHVCMRMDDVACACRFLIFDIPCVSARVCVCVFFSFLAVPNGMGVEADDALLDEGPQSLPAMRL